MHLPLLQFIVHYFLQWNLKCVAVFHCWDVATQYHFASLAEESDFYTQYVNLNKENSTRDFEFHVLRNERPQMGVFIDLNCEQSEDLLKRLSSLSYYNDHFRYLIYDEWSNVTHFRDIFTHLNLEVRTELTYATAFDEKSDNLTTFTLFDVYNRSYKHGGQLNMTLESEIDCTSVECPRQRFLSTLRSRSKYDDRSTLEGLTLRLAVVVTKRPLDTPFPQLHEFLMSIEERRLDVIARLGYQSVMLLTDYLGCNLSYKVHGSWSVTETTGGVVGDLIEGDADLASSPFLITAHRRPYTTPLYETNAFHSICLFRTPRNSGIQGDVFLKPFSFTVWIIFLGVLLIMGIFLWSTFVLETRTMRDYLGYVPSLLSTFLLSFGSACIQGSNLVPRSMGGRMAFFSLYLISFIMYNYYTSIVVSSLLGSPVKTDITTLGQLADSNLEVGLEPLPFTFVFLNVSQLPEVRRFVKRKIDSKPHPQNLWLPVEQGLVRVRDDPGFVFVFEASTGYFLIEQMYQPHEICDLNEVMLRPDKSLYVHVNTQSSFLEFIKLRELRLQETGVQLRLRRFWVKTRLNCYANSFVVEVGLEYTAPLFFMLLCAYGLVMLILFLEISFKKYEEKKKRCQNKDEK